MGGFGSGNHYHWWRPTKKTTVEDCLSIDAGGWVRAGVLVAGIRRAGAWSWKYASGEAFTVHYEADMKDQATAAVRLWYSWVWTATKQQESVDYRVRLTATQPHFKGLRWWFTCPLIVRGRTCGRRVAKLYMPPHDRYFGCRTCHDLTYTSAQTHDKRVDALRRNQDEIYRILDDPAAHLHSARLLIALKALR